MVHYSKFGSGHLNFLKVKQWLTMGHVEEAFNPFSPGHSPNKNHTSKGSSINHQSERRINCAQPSSLDTTNLTSSKIIQTQKPSNISIFVKSILTLFAEKVGQILLFLTSPFLGRSALSWVHLKLCIFSLWSLWWQVHKQVQSRCLDLSPWHERK